MSPGHNVSFPNTKQTFTCMPYKLASIDARHSPCLFLSTDNDPGDMTGPGRTELHIFIATYIQTIEMELQLLHVCHFNHYFKPICCFMTMTCDLHVHVRVGYLRLTCV